MEYELIKNEEFLKWYSLQIKNGYNSLLGIIELQELINKLVIWYEIKYPERELDFYEGITDYNFNDIKKLSKEMSFEQLLYRLSNKEISLLKGNYRSSSGFSIPIYEEGDLNGYNSYIGFSIKRNGKEFCNPIEYSDSKNLPRFVFSADPSTGLVNINNDLEEYVYSDNINLEELLSIFENDYKDKLDYTDLKECIYNHNIDLTLRNIIINFVVLKIIYSKNTTLEKGCIRSRRFINEFNKKLDLNIDIKFIDEIKNGKCKTYK